MRDRTRIEEKMIAIALVMLFAGSVWAEDADQEEDVSAGVFIDTGSNEDSDSLGLNIDVGFATAYVFRGLNVFQQESQRDQNMMIAPGITWSIFDTGFWAGYWGAFQITGDNIAENIDAGLGAEQDLLLGYDYELVEGVTVSAGLAYYFYPGAEIEGASWASWIEPSTGIGWDTDFLDIGFNFSYFGQLYKPADNSDFSYFYINPYIGNEFALHEHLGLDVKLSLGYKRWIEDSIKDNTTDVQFSLGLPIYLPKGFYVNPAFNVAWTNIEPVAVGGNDFTDPLQDDQRLIDKPQEVVFWGSLNVGVNL